MGRGPVIWLRRLAGADAVLSAASDGAQGPVDGLTLGLGDGDGDPVVLYIPDGFPATSHFEAAAVCAAPLSRCPSVISSSPDTARLLREASHAMSRCSGHGRDGAARRREFARLSATQPSGPGLGGAAPAPRRRTERFA